MMITGNWNPCSHVRAEAELELCSSWKECRALVLIWKPFEGTGNISRTPWTEQHSRFSSSLISIYWVKISIDTHHYSRELKKHWVSLTCLFSSGLWDVRFATWCRKSFCTPRSFRIPPVNKLGFHAAYITTGFVEERRAGVLGVGTWLTRFSLKSWILDTACQEKPLLNHTSNFSQ